MNDKPRYLTGAETVAYLDDAESRYQAQQAAVGAVPEQRDGLRLVSASAIPPETPVWLWDGRIPLQAITLLIGTGGLGKTSLVCEIAARVSRGQLGRSPAAVIFATVEDSRSHTLVPRLIAAGADLDLIHFVSVVEAGFENGITLPDDLAELETAIEAESAEMLVLDPLVAHLSSTLDSHRDHSVRRALGPLHALAEATGVAVLGVSHLNKSASTNPLTRLGGSVAFGNAARSVLLFAADPDDDNSPVRYLVHVKSNLSRLARALKFEIESRTIQDRAGGDINTSGFVWLGETTAQASDLLTDAEPDADRSERDIAREVIVDALSQSDERWTALVRLVKAEGVSEGTAVRARSELRREGRIESSKDGMKGGWSWRLVAELDHEATKLLTHNGCASSPKGAQVRGDDPLLSGEEIATVFDAEIVTEPHPGTATPTTPGGSQ
ncbi:MAG: AAA family ATPase [Acidobacteria bacterium]|nr:AAA family ATPase [Acidobacteriota bacterium]